MDLDLDYRQARACDFAGIQEIFKYYICNTPIVQAHDVSGLLQKIDQNLSFPADEDDDDTPAFPTYLPVPVIVARKIFDHDDSGKKSQVVGYTFLGPGRRYSSTRDLATMELFLFVHPEYVGRGIGGSLLSMLLMLVKSERGVGSFEWVAAGGNEYAHYIRHHVRARRIVAAVSVDPEGIDGGEWLPRWLETKGFVELKRSKKAGYRFGRL